MSAFKKGEEEAMTQRFDNPNGDYWLEVSQNPDSVNLSLRCGMCLMASTSVSPDDAPALMLAIAKAAGMKGDMGAPNTSAEYAEARALDYLQGVIDRRASMAAHVAVEAAVKAEAWELYSGAFPDADSYASLGAMPAHLAKAWINVARTARGLYGVAE